MKIGLPRWLAVSTLPALLVFVLLFYTPLVAAVLSSVDDPGGHGITLAHYASLLHDPLVRQGMLCSLEYALGSTALAFVWGSIWGCAMLRSFAGKRWYAALSKIPLVVPGVVVALMMLTLLEQGGFIARLLAPVLAPFGMSMPRVVRDPAGIGTVLGMAWKEAPLIGIVVGAALAGVPDRTLDAARSLGATALQAFLRVRVPLAMPGIAAATLLGFVRGMGAFAIPALLGPAYPKPVSVLMYEAFEYGNWPRVCALGVLLSCLSIVIALLYYRLLDVAAGASRFAHAGERMQIAEHR